MRIYSDSKVSDFLSRTTTDQRILFLNEWNEKRDHRERIYISYDSTNKNSQAGDIDLVEFGHPKDDQGKKSLIIPLPMTGIIESLCSTSLIPEAL